MIERERKRQERRKKYLINTSTINQNLRIIQDRNILNRCILFLLLLRFLFQFDFSLILLELTLLLVFVSICILFGRKEVLTKPENKVYPCKTKVIRRHKKFSLFRHDKTILIKLHRYVFCGNPNFRLPRFSHSL